MTPEQLKETRRKLGLKQKDVWDAFRYPVRTWQDMELGQKPIKPKVWRMLELYALVPKGKRPL